MNRIGWPAFLAGLISLSLAASCAAQGPPGGGGEAPWERNRREVQDRMGGMPDSVLKRQSLEKVVLPAFDDVVKKAREEAKKIALPLIDAAFHDKGRTITVPDDHPTIQAALDAAASGDTVTVKAGTYHEQIVMKDGVKLVSDAADGGDELAEVDRAVIRLPRRTLRTVIDGSKGKPSKHGMFDFDPGLGRKTIIDGFTIQNLPKQDHHVPGHAHGLNIRGASVVVMNCLIRKNGSTGLGCHVIFEDQDAPMAVRDFRWANVRVKASPVLYNNIVCDNLGLGIGCNHFATAFILGNEVFGNDDAELGDLPAPGIGAKHGAAPLILGNLVHGNVGGGILVKVGKPQGKQPIDRPTHPTIRLNVIYANAEQRPGIGCEGAGSRELPVKVLANFVVREKAVGIGLVEGAVGVVEDNLVARTGLPGIAVNGGVALRLNRNKVRDTGAPGLVIVQGGKVLEMIGNAADNTQGPRFVLRGGTVGTQDTAKKK